MVVPNDAEIDAAIVDRLQMHVPVAPNSGLNPKCAT
jgi:hypothetical protein